MRRIFELGATTELPFFDIPPLQGKPQDKRHWNVFLTARHELYCVAIITSCICYSEVIDDVAIHSQFYCMLLMLRIMTMSLDPFIAKDRIIFI
jgi:hypothetical protein